MKKYYIFIRTNNNKKMEPSLIFWTTTFSDSCLDAVWKEFNPVFLRNRYGTGIMFASLKDSPKRSNGSAQSF